MAFDTSIQSPYTLAQLPHPVADGFKGRFLAADVLSGSKKRKRPEVAVGIDGEGINIYDVRLIQSPKLITSYAIPPQSTFTCAPCSLRLKSKTPASIRRTTYVSIANPTPRILCFSETANKSSSRSGSFTDASTITSHRDLNPTESPIIHLDTLPPVKEPKVDTGVIAVHENGITRCLSADLGKEHWCTSVSTALSGDGFGDDLQRGFVVEYAATTDALTARRGLLKSREDALSLLNSDTNNGAQATSILFLVTRPSDNALLATAGRSVHILSAQPSLLNDSSSSRRRPQALLTLRLPPAASQTEASPGKTRFTLYPSSGTLYQVADGNLTVYDFSSAAPKISSQLSLKTPGPVSVLRVSQAIILTASPTSIDMYNIRYRSLQSSLPTSEIPASSPLTKKRKFVDPVPNRFSEQVTLVSYFADSGLAIGLAGPELVAIRVNLPSEFTGRGGRKGDDLLINAIGRGIEVPRDEIDVKPWLGDLSTILKKYHPGGALSDQPRMERLISGMDRYAARGDLENFEKSFAKQVGIGLDESNLEGWRARRDAWEEEHGLKRGGEADSAELANGLGRHDSDAPGTPILEDHSPKFPEERPLPQWKLPREFRAGERFLVDPRLVTYVLGKIFSWNDEVGPQERSVKSGLSIVLYAPNVFRWLVESGNFSILSLEQSIRRTSPRSNFMGGLPTGNFVNALADFDPEMKLLLFILRSPVYLDVGELLSALRLLMRSLEFPINGDRPTPQQITNGETLGSPAINGDSTIDLRFEEDAAERDLDLALSVLETGPAIREEALTAVLTRLHSFPSAAIIKGLRKELNGDEILLLVRLLRNELSRGGWTSSYFDEDVEEINEESQQSPSERGARLVSDLISCALDSSGPGGWLMGAAASNGGDDSMEGMVANLRSEVSAALECIEEATYLSGLLGEMIRYGKSVARDQKNFSKNPKTKSRKIKESSQAPECGLLPLGLKAERGISRTRVGAGGEIRGRSARDRGNLISKTVGKYSFERIKI
ncbi:hypothetical protein FGG08_001507 [Glutinoglossum americanum]|uniref:Utp8 beta-propeller domain-containing protein n=1 Tax=Glutinoglossum americanum TaxID=1670608 RepID=A0A9P8I200_9PEZI|nr:hypothetical protein FGG08_001507 [Glutinoglossum americanum]